MKARWRKYASCKPRKGPSVAERQLATLHARPLVLPEGADPELGGLFGREVG